MIIAITGHRPDAFLQSHYSEERIRQIANDTVLTFKRNYKDDNLKFNLGGAIGTDQWVADACIQSGVKFELFLPMLPEVQSRFWLEEQQKALADHITKTCALNIVDTSGEYNKVSYFERNMIMVDNADIVVAFWVGKKGGGTYHAMDYALRQNKFVLNALNELKPVFLEDLKAGWTPPTVKRENND